VALDEGDGGTDNRDLLISFQRRVLDQFAVNRGPSPFHFLLAVYAGWINRHQLAVIEYLRAEIAVLREQLPRKNIPFTDRQRLKLAHAAQRIGRALLRQHASLATPDTLLGWYRNLIARKYDGSDKRRPGRPRTPDEIRRRIVQLANENPTWGYPHIEGQLKVVGINVSSSTIRRVLLEVGLEPETRRARRLTWKRFLEAHWSSLAAADFFTVEALTWRGLVRLHVFFVIELRTRAVEIAGVVAEPHGAWMLQVARNLLDGTDGFLRGKTRLIVDRGSVFTAEFRAFLARAGVECVRLPPRSPNLNAFAERFVRSVRSECLDHLIIVSEQQLRGVLHEYIEHYNHERAHQGIGNVLIRAPPTPANDNGPIRRRRRLGGLLNFYFRGAA
jgi:putative transposase